MWLPEAHSPGRTVIPLRGRKQLRFSANSKVYRSTTRRRLFQCSSFSRARLVGLTRAPFRLPPCLCRRHQKGIRSHLRAPRRLPGSALWPLLPLPFWPLRSLPPTKVLQTPPLRCGIGRIRPGERSEKGTSGRDSRPGLRARDSRHDSSGVGLPARDSRWDSCPVVRSPSRCWESFWRGCKRHLCRFPKVNHHFASKESITFQPFGPYYLLWRSIRGFGAHLAPHLEWEMNR